MDLCFKRNFSCCNHSVFVDTGFLQSTLPKHDSIIFFPVLMFSWLKEQFTAFPIEAYLFEHQADGGEHNRIDSAGGMRAYGNTAHTGDTCLFIHFLRIFLVDGLYRTFCRTDAAARTLLCRFRYHTGTGGLFVRAAAGDRGLRKISRGELALNLFCKLRKLLRILRAGPAGGPRRPSRCRRRGGRPGRGAAWRRSLGAHCGRRG